LGRNLLPRRALSQIVASFGRASGQMTSPTRLAGWRSGRPPEGSVPKDAVDRVHPELSRPRGLSNAPAERSAPVAVCACHHAVVFFEIGDARINVRRESAATTTCSCYDPRPRATAAATAAAAAEFTPDPRPLRARLRCHVRRPSVMRCECDSETPCSWKKESIVGRYTCPKLRDAGWGTSSSLLSPKLSRRSCMTGANAWLTAAFLKGNGPTRGDHSKHLQPQVWRRARPL